MKYEDINFWEALEEFLKQDYIIVSKVSEEEVKAYCEAFEKETSIPLIYNEYKLDAISSKTIGYSVKIKTIE